MKLTRHVFPSLGFNLQHHKIIMMTMVIKTPIKMFLPKNVTNSPTIQILLSVTHRPYGLGRDYGYKDFSHDHFPTTLREKIWHRKDTSVTKLSHQQDTNINHEGPLHSH